MPIEYSEAESKEIVDGQFRFLCRFFSIPLFGDKLLGAASQKLLQGFPELLNANNKPYTQETLKIKLTEICNTPNGSITEALNLGVKVVGITGNDLLGGLVKFMRSPKTVQKPEGLEIGETELNEEQLTEIKTELDKDETKQELDKLTQEGTGNVGDTVEQQSDQVDPTEQVNAPVDQEETEQEVVDTVAPSEPEPEPKPDQEPEPNTGGGTKRPLKNKRSKNTKRLITQQKKNSKLTRVKRSNPSRKKTISRKPNKTLKNKKRV